MKRFLAVAVSAIFFSSPAFAAPTPVPGGANQVRALPGSVGRTVFNGMVRLTLLDVRAATAEESAAYHPIPGKKVLVFDMLIRNGTNDSFTDLIEYTLADKDDVTVAVPTSEYTHANLNIQQGAATRQKAIFAVDDDFVPVKLIAACATCPAKTAFRAVRFTL